jgi:hypothetical protein
MVETVVSPGWFTCLGYSCCHSTPAAEPAMPAIWCVPYLPCLVCHAMSYVLCVPYLSCLVCHAVSAMPCLPCRVWHVVCAVCVVSAMPCLPCRVRHVVSTVSCLPCRMCCVCRVCHHVCVYGVGHVVWHTCHAVFAMSCPPCRVCHVCHDVFAASGLLESSCVRMQASAPWRVLSLWTWRALYSRTAHAYRTGPK